MDSKNLMLFRLGCERKILLFSALFGLALLAPAYAGTPTIYHPYLQRSVPLHTLNPEYLWQHLDDPLLQERNDMKQVQSYLETLGQTTTPPSLLTRQDLRVLGIRAIYDPYIYQYIRLDKVTETRLSYLLQDPRARALTLENARPQPQTLKAYYQSLKNPRIVVYKKPGFRNSHLCISWIEHGHIVKETPPNCSSF